MERLPYIDEHVTTVDACQVDTWTALVKWAFRNPDDLSTVRMPFFSLERATWPERLALKGRHAFSVYRLVFELAPDGPHRTRLSAHTWAEFPGMSGRVYRALVIGSGGHRIAVRRMLNTIAAKARRHTSTGA